MPVREEVQSWVEEARADLKHGEASIKIGDYNWACFATQQAAEKALKALILHIHGEYPQGHDLVKLYSGVKEDAQLNLRPSDLSRLSAYYTQARCPKRRVKSPSKDALPSSSSAKNLPHPAL